MIVIVAPGQGSQSPGFLDSWVSESRYRDHLAQLADHAGLDLIAHGTTSDADTIKDTRIAQPLIVAASLMTLAAVLAGRREHVIGGIAGHSVGEISAAAGAGILSEPEAMRFVSARGDAMADAAAKESTGMAAAIGGDREALLARLDELGLRPANFNGGGQIVVAGPNLSLAELAATAPAGCRIVPLKVAGAFHTPFMESATVRLGKLAATLTTNDPHIPIWTNRDGGRVDSGTRFLELMVGQVSSPVHWDKTMQSLDTAGVSGIIELAPAGALVGLAKRSLPGVPTVAVKTPDDLPAAFRLLDGNPPV